MYTALYKPLHLPPGVSTDLCLDTSYAIDSGGLRGSLQLRLGTMPWASATRGASMGCRNTSQLCCADESPGHRVRQQPPRLGWDPEFLTNCRYCCCCCSTDHPLHSLSTEKRAQIHSQANSLSLRLPPKVRSVFQR